MNAFILQPYQASAALRAFILAQAPAHVAVDNPPSTLEALQAAYLTGEPLPVWNGGSETTIWGDAATNHAFRAWHDMFHIVYSCPLDAAGELAVAELADVAAKFSGHHLTIEDSDTLLYEVIGQLMHEQAWGHFPHNQALFIAACHHLGYQAACETEY